MLAFVAQSTSTAALPTHRAVAQCPPLAGLPSVLGEVEALCLGWMLFTVPRTQVKSGTLKGQVALLGAAPSLAHSTFLATVTAPKADAIMFWICARCTQALSGLKAFDGATF